MAKRPDISKTAQQNDLFNHSEVVMRDERPELLPLAERLRPRTWDQVIGQSQSLPRLKEMSQREFWPSLLIHGPPGCGKTSMINVLKLSFPGVWLTAHGSELKTSEIRSLSEEGRNRKIIESKQTLVFVDEIHALTKVQQEALLEPVEKGHIVVLGATTENPIFFLRPALRSRLRLIELQALSAQDIRPLLERAQDSLEISNGSLKSAPAAPPLSAESLTLIAQASQGDARRALVHLEAVWDEQKRQGVLSEDQILSLIAEQSRPALSEDDYNATLSAMIKSIRGSDPDAALLWMTQLLDGGIDGRVILRRLIISASEDIGNAEPRALPLAVAAAQGFEWVGVPEGRLAIAQAVLFLATCPKSDSVYVSANNARTLVEKGYPLKVPQHLQQTGKEKYENPHDFARGWTKQRYRPEGLNPEVPVVAWSGRGHEKKMIDYLQWLRQQPITNAGSVKDSSSEASAETPSE